MDLSSGIAVYALDVQPGEHVLDICCAPGTISDQLIDQLIRTRSALTDQQMSCRLIRNKLDATLTSLSLLAIRRQTLYDCRTLDQLGTCPVRSVRRRKPTADGYHRNSDWSRYLAPSPLNLPESFEASSTAAVR